MSEILKDNTSAKRKTIFFTLTWKLLVSWVGKEKSTQTVILIPGRLSLGNSDLNGYPGTNGTTPDRFCSDRSFVSVYV